MTADQWTCELPAVTHKHLGFEGCRESEGSVGDAFGASTNSVTLGLAPWQVYQPPEVQHLHSPLRSNPAFKMTVTETVQETVGSTIQNVSSTAQSSLEQAKTLLPGSDSSCKFNRLYPHSKNPSYIDAK